VGAHEEERPRDRGAARARRESRREVRSSDDGGA
jgi:hypothetical protein